MTGGVGLSCLFLAVALAGCTGDGTTSSLAPAGENGADGTTVGLSVEAGANATAPDANFTEDGVPRFLLAGGCTFDLGAIPVPASEVQAGLPSGFKTVPFFNSVLNVQDPTGATALVILVGTTCANATGPELDVGAVTVATAAVAVLPPPEYQNASVGQYYIGMGAVSDPTVGALYRAWGIGDAGTATSGASLPLGSNARVARTEMALGSFSFTLTTATETQPSARQELVVRFFALSDGAVTGAVDIHLPAAMQTLGESAAQFSGGSGVFARPAMSGLGLYVHGPDLAFRFTYTPWNATGA